MLTFTRSISGRIFFLLVILLAFSFAVVLYYNIKAYTAHLHDYVLKNAIQISSLIKSACYHSMLKNDREGLQNIIMSLGKEEGIDGIRIYNREGRISFSKDKAEIHHVADKRAEQCYVCHKEEPAKGLIPTKDLTRTLISPGGYRQLGLVNPIENSPECYNAQCHAHSKDQQKLGLLDVKLSLKKIDEEIARTKTRMLIYSIALILLTALLKGGFIILLVHKPIKKLIKGVREVAKLNLDYKVDVKSNDELGELAASFNEMTKELKNAQNALKEWAHKLEEKVREKTEELKKAQAQMIMTEKMASLGKLSAQVAHEINNPIFGILSYAKLTLRSLEEAGNNITILEDAKQNLKFITNEAKRCGEIVKSLLIFAKKTTGVIREEHLSNVIDSSMRLVEHAARMKGVNLLKKTEPGDDTVYGDANALTQVFVALLVNGIEAVREGGFVKIRILPKEAEVEVSVEDNGVGIPEEILPHIFEPFFTTKESERSTGLGLSVAYGIVDQHGGKIEVTSRPGQGTIFRVILPRHLPGGR